MAKSKKPDISFTVTGSAPGWQLDPTWQFGPDRQDYIEQTTAAYVAAYKKRNAVAKALSRRFGLAASLAVR